MRVSRPPDALFAPLRRLSPSLPPVYDTQRSCTQTASAVPASEPHAFTAARPAASGESPHAPHSQFSSHL
jgi:hypothetical protein